MTRVVFLVVDALELFDLAGPVQVFHEAALAGADYTLQFVSDEPRARSEQSLSFDRLEPLPHDLGPGDIAIVPGSRLFRDPRERRTPRMRRYGQWIRDAYTGGAQIASVCVGAFLLGSAGLLDGRRATTHWRFIEELQRTFARANVLADRLYVFDERIATSAGIASGVDLALALVERDAGARVAAATAREMVLSVRRPGNEAQLSAFFAEREHFAHDVHAVQDWVIAHLGEPFSLESLAAHLGMSPRTLTRRFRAATGTTVNAYATSLRLEHARSLLRDPALSVDAVAERCGFSDGRHLRRLWRSTFGSAPSTERRSRSPES